MARLSINLLGWNHRQQIGPVIEAVLRQSYRDFELFYTDNASTDGSANFVRQHFPEVIVRQNTDNLGYTGGHNSFFEVATSELVMVLNPDALLHKEYLQHAVRGFDDPRVGSVTGKTYSSAPGVIPPVIDSTGNTIDRFRRGRDRGQHETDRGQYDQQTEVFGASGAIAMFRRRALEQVKMPVAGGRFEYFDEDFFAYWEDFDLSWRLRLMAWKCLFVPQAIVYHPRKASSNPGGYRKFISFVRHHRALSATIRRWNWRNHLFCIIKNDFGWPLLAGLPFIIARELAMMFYILIFEPGTLTAVPDFFKLLPKMLAKRQYIIEHKVVGSKEAGKWFKS